MSIWIWIGFFSLVAAVLVLDLGVFNRKAHAISPLESLAWTAFWISLALAFNAGVYYIYEHHWLGIGLDTPDGLSGSQAALQFFTGYLIEESLSLDNIFIMALIFSYFKVPQKYQHRVLFWGIFGAVVLRGLMIAGGLALINRFEWVAYVFGAILLMTAVKMLISSQENVDPEKNLAVRLARKIYPVTTRYDGLKFFTRVHGKRAVTPLFLALLMVETTDVLFAVDSIPAVIAVTRDPFLVLTSNVFAILGLRSLYFVIAGIMEKMRYIKTSLVFLLAFVGMKMILSRHFHIPAPISLAVIAGILSVGILASIFAPVKTASTKPSAISLNMERLAGLTYKNAKRILVLIIGTSVLLVGVAMIVLPGPAVIVIPAGLGILATEFVWARSLLKKAKHKAESLADAAQNMMHGGGKRR